MCKNDGLSFSKNALNHVFDCKYNIYFIIISTTYK